MCLGITFTWPPTTLRLLESANTTLHRPMTELELAIFGSLSSVGALITTPICGVYLDRVGRKNMSILSCIMGVLSWTMIASSSRVEVLLTAMFVCGLSGSVFLIVPVFISEICDESVRGATTSCTMIFYGVGMLVSYLLGGCLEYHTMAYVCVSMTSTTTVSLALLNESPTCLMIKGMEKVKSLMSMVVIEWAWLCNSVILFIFNPLLKAIGLGPVFYLFAAVSALTGIYSVLFVPETNKKRRKDVVY